MHSQKKQKQPTQIIGEEDAELLVQDNKILKVVQDLKKSHNGPVSTIEELTAVVERFGDDKKELDKALSLK